MARGVVLTKPTLAHKVFPKKARMIKAKKTKVRIKIKVKSAVDLAAKGRVTVSVAGHKYNAKVKDGVAKVKLRTFARPGKYKVVAQFRANATFQGSKRQVHHPRQALKPASGGPVRRAPTAVPGHGPGIVTHPTTPSENSCPHVPPSGAARCSSDSR